MTEKSLMADGLVFALRDVAQFVGEEALVVPLGEAEGLRYFLSDAVTLTYAYAEFTEGHGFVETLLYACPQWRAEVSTWYEYRRRRDRVETAWGLVIDGDTTLVESWLDRVWTDLLPAEYQALSGGGVARRASGHAARITHVISNGDVISKITEYSNS
jgi:hypothetical protein